MRGVLSCAAIAAVGVNFTATAFAGTGSEAERAAEAARQEQIQQLAEQQKQPPKSYWYIEAGPAYFDMDVSNGFGAAIGDLSDDFVRQPDDGLDFGNLGVKGAVGLVQPIKNGKKRFMARVDAAWVKHDEDNALTLTTDEFVDILPITGDVTPSFVAAGPIPIITYPGSTDVRVSAEGKFYRFGAFLGVGKEKRTEDRRCLVGVGAYGSFGKVNFESRISGVNPSFLIFDEIPVVPTDGFIHKDEKVDIWSVGPMLTGEVGFALSERVDFTLGGRVAGLYSNGSLNARQQALDFIGTTYDYSVGDDDSGFAYMGELKAGFDFAASDRVTLSLFGSAEGRNDYYRIKNPRSGPGLNHGSAASYNPGPVQLDQNLQFIASIGAAAKFAF